MLRPEFVEGVNLLQRFGFTFDLCIDYRHTNLAAEFVDRCSNVPMVLDHIGKPGISQGLLDPWRREIKELAKRENLWCKFSSLATEADHESWDLETLSPYTDAVLEAFGLDRCFFAGDWPVSTLAADYSTCVETAGFLASGFASSKDDLERLFHHNAEKFYGI
jgi:L-fuconolactonase